MKKEPEEVRKESKRTQIVIGEYSFWKNEVRITLSHKLKYVRLISALIVLVKKGWIMEEKILRQQELGPLSHSLLFPTSDHLIGSHFGAGSVISEGHTEEPLSSPSPYLKGCDLQIEAEPRGAVHLLL